MIVEAFTILGIVTAYVVITILGGVITTYSDESGDSFFFGSYLIGAAIFFILTVISVENHYFGL